VTVGRGVEDLLRELAPQVLGALVRRYGQFHLCEDASQEALLAAAVRWPADGIPENPRGWLITVGSRRLMDQIRSEQSRRSREELIAVATPQSELLGPPADAEPTDRDDSLALLFGCCHSELSAPSQIALTLRAVGGLTTTQIAAAFGVPEATMAQRISRAKQTIRQAGFDLSLPSGAEQAERLAAVLHVLYLVFNEGYTASDGDDLTVPGLSQEAIRLTRWLHRLLPEDSEVAGLLALMLLTDARRPARTRPDGSLVPLAEQDRQQWDRDLIAEGTALITAALPRGQAGPYQLQAAIAAVHDEAATIADTDWPQILGLYDLLQVLAPNPFTALNRAVAVGMVHGPEAGLGVLQDLAADQRMARHHRLLAAQAHLRELAGDREAAAADYLAAARHATSLPERRYLAIQAARLDAAATLSPTSPSAQAPRATGLLGVPLTVPLAVALLVVVLAGLGGGGGVGGGRALGRAGGVGTTGTAGTGVRARR
jgi:RNA polymerase sigma factor (sigma-70 family)